MSHSPTVSLGLPVYNGQKHLAAALDSIRAQTFGDFELIISDNASTDATPDICRQYARRDGRIRYVRNPRNLGASPNFNRVVHLARGRYFKWAAHDDLLAPTCLERCVDVLDHAPPSVVLCFPRRRYITYDEGRVIGSALEAVAGVSTEAGMAPGQATQRVQRLDDITFAKLLRLAGGWCPTFVFGLIRSHVMRKTGLLRPFAASDLVLVAELRLLGEFREVPEELYFQRLHPSSGWTLRKNRRQEAAWFDPNRSEPPLSPRLHLYWQYLRVIGRAPVAASVKVARYADIVGRLGEACGRQVSRLLNTPAVEVSQ